jgi:beta-lactamase regulating signal transducer with metallopeptidase domain
MKTELHFICEQLVGSSLNGIYQGVLLCGLVAGLLRFCGRDRTNATTRYEVWFFCLLLIVFMLPAHYCLDRSANRGVGLAQNDFTALPSVHIPPVIPSNAPRLTTLKPAEGDFFLPEGVVPDAPIVEAYSSRSQLEDSDANRLRFRSEESGSLDQKVDAANPAKWHRIGFEARLVGERLLQPVSRNINSMVGFPLVATLVFLWIVIAGCRVIILAVQLQQLRKFLTGSILPTPELNARFAKVRSVAEMRRSVRLRISMEHKGPLVLGFLKPTILLPADLAEPSKADEADHVLRHELAHVRRYDDWVNLIQHFIQAILFFHPAVWWIGRRLSLEREVACDDHALEQGGEKRDYAFALASVAGRLCQKAPILAPGVSSNHSQLEQRINMILNPRRNSSPRLAKGRLASVVSLTALSAFFVLYTCPRLLLAATSSDSPVPAIDGDTVTSTTAPSVKVSIDPIRVKVRPKVEFASADASSPVVVGEPGPKFKPENADAQPAPPAGVESPEIPDVPSIDAAPRAPRAPRPPRAARLDRARKGPQPPDFLDAPNEEDSSIEDRLKRLEKMVRAMVEQQGMRHPRAAFNFRDENENYNVDQQQIQIDKMKQMAERQAQRAAEQAERATQDIESRLGQQRDGVDFHESSQHQLDAMRKAREGLSRELERLDHQIEKLQKEQELTAKDGLGNRSDTDGKQLDDQVLTTPQPAK